MKIAVCVKQVPDTWAEKTLQASDSTLDRDAADGVINELDEYAVEEALQLAEAHGGEVAVVTMGPERAAETIRKALSMGADTAVHLVDDGLHGSDALATSYALAEVLKGRRVRPGHLRLGVDGRAHERGPGDGRRAARGAAADVRAARSTSRAARSRSSARPRRATTPSRRRCPQWSAWWRRSTSRGTRRSRGSWRRRRSRSRRCRVADAGLDASRSGPVGGVEPGRRLRRATAEGRRARSSPTRGTAAPRSPRSCPRRSSSESARSGLKKRKSQLWLRSWSSSSTSDGSVKKVTIELLTLARRLGEPSAVWVGPGIERRGCRGAGRVRRREGLRRRRRGPGQAPGRAEGRGAGAAGRREGPRGGADRVDRRRQGGRRPARGAHRLRRPHRRRRHRRRPDRDAVGVRRLDRRPLPGHQRHADHHRARQLGRTRGGTRRAEPRRCRRALCPMPPRRPPSPDAPSPRRAAVRS